LRASRRPASSLNFGSGLGSNQDVFRQWSVSLNTDFVGVHYKGTTVFNALVTGRYNTLGSLGNIIGMARAEGEASRRGDVKRSAAAPTCRRSMKPDSKAGRAGRSEHGGSGPR
jgi:hypothetical protein